MLNEFDMAYFAERELAARALADRAVDPAARRAHLEMAAAYRRRQGANDEAAAERVLVERAPRTAA
ncbi:hypothetical protein ABC347_12900 [Sphingomonas sp. 1P06PA]|uniref:hypothetical protein n=1 Tax=Sphingomonas sp. 1P06PA TaxID=554121 RepID=UPI0039A57799